MAQWIRTQLAMQGTQVQALVGGIPTYLGASKPVGHSCWARALHHTCRNCWSPACWSPCSAAREAHVMRKLRAATTSDPSSTQPEKAL